ncbi:MAG: SusD/RagB family nutrient-binding outer rane lipoprotein, partial [Sphingobacterium sp.]|nr:SusD/RagB family nutrient-binding outer rane lipoprotein [Sphingobacterium sp.]
MKRNFKKIVFAFLLGTIAFTSCNKYLDINQNPNYPETAEPRLLLPTVQASIGQIIGNQLQVYGGLWSQVWTQNPTSSQYITIDQYNVKSTATNSVWSNMYRYALYNAQVITKSESTLDNYYKGIAYILKAYTFQLATDAFGDVPLD